MQSYNGFSNSPNFEREIFLRQKNIRGKKNRRAGKLKERRTGEQENRRTGGETEPRLGHKDKPAGVYDWGLGFGFKV